jgi:AraC-like DNA-binding protein
MYESTSLARFPLFFLQIAQEMGLDREELLAAAELHEDDLRDPDRRVPLAKMWKLWPPMLAAAPEALGVRVGGSMRARTLGLVGYAMLHAETLGGALSRLVRYGRILSDLFTLRMEQRDGLVRLTLASIPPVDPFREPVVARLAALVSVVRDITQSELRPAEVHFPFPAPEDTARYRSFFGGRLVFEQSQNTLVYSQRDLDLPVVAADRTLLSYLDQLAKGVLETLSVPESFADRTRRAIWSDLSDGAPKLQQTAARLGVSARTLQRRLRSEGSSFAGVLDGLRREGAKQLLRDRSLAVYEVAFLLGYSEPSTFFRAFRRWEHTSPHDFRRLNG